MWPGMCARDACAFRREEQSNKECVILAYTNTSHSISSAGFRNVTIVILGLLPPVFPYFVFAQNAVQLKVTPYSTTGYTHHFSRRRGSLACSCCREARRESSSAGDSNRSDNLHNHHALTICGTCSSDIAQSSRHIIYTTDHSLCDCWFLGVTYRQQMVE